MTHIAERLSRLSLMSFPILTDAASKGLVILVIALILSLFLHKASAAWRHWVWLLALAATGILPLLSCGLPVMSLAILPTPSATEPPDPSIAESLAPAWADAGPVAPRIPYGQTLEPSESLPKPAMLNDPVELTWRDWSVLIWMAGVVVSMCPLLAGLLCLLAMHFRCTPLQDKSLHESVSQLSNQLHIKTSISIIQQKPGRKAVPIVWGVLRPALIWPGEYATWDQTQIQSVLLHELAHVKRHDWLSQIVGIIICALHWFNPLAWLAVNRMRVESEKACDDQVLQAGIKNTDYAQHLLNIARDLIQPQPLASVALAMARTSQVDHRLRDILHLNKNRKGLTYSVCTLGLIGTLITTIPLAAMRATARSATEFSQTQGLLTISGKTVIGANESPGNNVKLGITVRELTAHGIPTPT